MSPQCSPDSEKPDIVERMRERWLECSRASFDSVDAGISANLLDEAIDEIERLRTAAQSAPSREEFEIVRKASRLFEDAANQWMDRALKAEAKLATLPSTAQPVTVTDAMCEAAINSDAPDCIRGFTYWDRFVIRDVWSEKELWSAPAGGTAPAC